MREATYKLAEVFGISFNPEALRWGYRFSPWKEEGGTFYKAFSLETGSLFLAFFEKIDGEWYLRIKGAETDEERALRLIEKTLGHREDLVPLLSLSKSDPMLARALRELPGYRLKSTPSPHEALFSAIISQNVSRDGFFKMLAEFKELLGVRVEADGYVDFVFPSLEELRDFDPFDFKDRRLIHRASIIRDIAREVDGDFFVELSRDPLSGIDALVKFRGVGEYTARATLLYGYRAYEIPVVDRYIQKMLAYLYADPGLREPNGLIAFALDRWGEYAGYAVDLLIAWSQKNER